MPPSFPHYGKLVCVSCGAFLGWLPKPGTVERRRMIAFRLAKLARCDALTAWERAFIRDVSQQRKLSPRQQAVAGHLAQSISKEKSRGTRRLVVLEPMNRRFARLSCGD